MGRHGDTCKPRGVKKHAKNTGKDRRAVCLLPRQPHAAHERIINDQFIKAFFGLLPIGAIAGYPTVWTLQLATLSASSTVWDVQGLGSALFRLLPAICTRVWCSVGHFTLHVFGNHQRGSFAVLLIKSSGGNILYCTACYVQQNVQVRIRKAETHSSSSPQSNVYYYS